MKEETGLTLEPVTVNPAYETVFYDNRNDR